MQKIRLEEEPSREVRSARVGKTTGRGMRGEPEAEGRHGWRREE
jgi:hypothetical protein